MHTNQSNIKTRAQALLNKTPLIIDTETTGLNHPEIIQLSIVSTSGNVVFNGKFKPLTTIETGASRVHGHTAVTLADADEWATHATNLNFILKNNTITAYNLPFDIKALRYTYQTHAHPYPKFDTGDCIMELFAELYGDWNNYHQSYRWQKLSTAAKYFGITNPAPHDAYGDALTALEVLNAMANLT